MCIRDRATTSDFVHYEDKGVAIPRGTDEEQDQFIFAGSVFEAEGQYHIFYTGYNRDYPALGKPSQVLMHAYSDDLVTWLSLIHIFRQMHSTVRHRQHAGNVFIWVRISYSDTKIRNIKNRQTL